MHQVSAFYSASNRLNETRTVRCLLGKKSLIVNSFVNALSVFVENLYEIEKWKNALSWEFKQIDLGRPKQLLAIAVGWRTPSTVGLCPTLLVINLLHDIGAM